MATLAPEKTSLLYKTRDHLPPVSSHMGYTSPYPLIPSPPPSPHSPTLEEKVDTWHAAGESSLPPWDCRLFPDEYEFWHRFRTSPFSSRRTLPRPINLL